MADSPVYRMRFRRRRQGKTDYRKRLALVKSGKPRLVVRKSLSNIYVQLVEFGHSGDRTVFAASGPDIAKMGWKGAAGNLPAAYLVGYLLGKKAAGREAVIDIGMQHPAKGGRIFAAVKGAIDGGLIARCDESVFPAKERMEGANVKDAGSFQKAKSRIDGEK